jgi:hypothetical protein
MATGLRYSSPTGRRKPTSSIIVSTCHAIIEVQDTTKAPEVLWLDGELISTTQGNLRVCTQYYSTSTLCPATWFVYLFSQDRETVISRRRRLSTSQNDYAHRHIRLELKTFVEVGPDGKDRDDVEAASGQCHVDHDYFHTRQRHQSEAVIRATTSTEAEGALEPGR